MREEEQISAAREFNRFYTARLGLLRKRHLDGDHSLTEARILYEIGAAPGLTASSLRITLGLNAGYVSRILTLLTKLKLVRQNNLKAGRSREAAYALECGEDRLCQAERTIEPASTGATGQRQFGGLRCPARFAFQDPIHPE